MKISITSIFLIMILMSCGGKKSNPQPGLTPGAATLLSPANNQPCVNGTILSPTQSTVLFSWASSANTDSYDLVIKNLLTITTQTLTTNTTQLNVTLLNNTPYSWYLVSKTISGSNTTQSSIWKFYNSGPGIVTYAPFPADITSPTFGQNINATGGTVNLTWNGSSVSSNISYYNVYFGPTATPPLLPGNVTNSFLNNVSVTSGTTYYWRVITVDTNGNNSDSGLYQFKVN